MNLQSEPELTFGRIAAEWHRELRGGPGALAEPEVLHKLLAAFWRGDFEPHDHPDQTCITIGWAAKFGQPSSNTDRRGLKLWACDTEPGDGDTTSSLTPLATRHAASRSAVFALLKMANALPKAPLGDQPFQTLMNHPPDAYGKGGVANILILLTISKDHFAEWSLAHGHTLPSFWFSTEDQKERRANLAGRYAKGEARPRAKSEIRGKRAGPYLRQLFKLLEYLYKTQGEAYFDTSVGSIARDVRRAWPQYDLNGTRPLPKSASGLNDAIRKWKHQQGLS